jgi:hypothetical protein
MSRATKAFSAEVRQAQTRNTRIEVGAGGYTILQLLNLKRSQRSQVLYLSSMRGFTLVSQQLT